MKVLLVDDHAVVRQGYASLLRALLPDVQLREASDGEQALQRVQEEIPNLVIMDIGLPGISGLETTRRLRQRLPQLRVLFFSMHDELPLVRQALDTAVLVRPDGTEIAGDALAELARQYQLSRGVIERLSRVIDADALRAIAEGVSLDLSNEAAAEASARTLKARLLEMQGNASSANGGATADAFMQYDEKTEKYRIMVVRRQHGNQRLSHIDADFVAGADYAALSGTAATFQGLIGEGAKVRRGTGDKVREQNVADFHAAMTWLLSEAERGVSRQRYKGLGEMNPEQLWETTMDVTQRRLLRVQIEDAIAADQIFTTLMGDDVEPRRNFIESNALVARNIDV